jgi:hypothetical protein
MKTLFVSLAFFLYAEANLLTIENAAYSPKENTALTLEELTDFRKETPQSISQSLTKTNWVNTTEREIKAENIDKDGSSWELGTGAVLYYSPATGEKSNYEGPYITYIVGTEGSYYSLVRQAKGNTKKLTWCRDAEHDVDKYDKELHYSNIDYNIIFTQDDSWGTFLGTIRIFGKRK